ncbi:PIN domain-containing protein [Verminephrobacter aporrectodeae subsp. tuberculatae]|uniref:PIN domain-containing protein n=1 Tax=Verminephrobacter aporrectodeae subsp. tuberculatae TaxID=1110392 RepID=A0ABT3KXE5_9BURK|nr:type II toxin-antitoxin system VapC family toxin [Verminephrobacter aporrectodeae]MCW5322988.1 PIN domain-containing protein [Verminephrobacter aporrectodeae subsp. tuberculatae]
MIGLDTNVLVRYIMQDDPGQSAQASRLIESLDADNPGFISLVTVVELYWVLTSSYELAGKQAVQALESIVRTKQFFVERADLVLRALRACGAGKADFPDCLIERSAASAGCARTMTFDVRAAKHAGMTLVG